MLMTEQRLSEEELAQIANERNWRLQKLQSTMFAMWSESNVGAAEKC